MKELMDRWKNEWMKEWMIDLIKNLLLAIPSFLNWLIEVCSGYFELNDTLLTWLYSFLQQNGFVNVWDIELNTYMYI